MFKNIKSIKIAGAVLLAVGFFVFVFFYVTPVFRGDFLVSSGFHLGSFGIHFYGLTLAVGVLVSWFVASSFANRLNISGDQVDRSLFWVLVGGFLGARAYHVIFSWNFYSQNLSEVFKVWHGGLAIVGGVVGGAVGLLMFCKKEKISPLPFLDLVAVSLPLGQAIGRWGNFFNQEAFGYPTSLPWGLYIEPTRRPEAYLFASKFHPAFLYESLWDLIVFLILVYLITRTKSKPFGYLAGVFLILYALGRFFIERLRLDSFFIGQIRVDQVSVLILALVGLGLIIFSYGKNNNSDRSSMARR